MKQLTEKEAWTFLALLWRANIFTDRLYSNGELNDQRDDMTRYGFCGSIDTLEYRDVISEDVAWSMRRKLNKTAGPKSIDLDMIWDMDFEGDKLRIRYAQGWAKRLA